MDSTALERLERLEEITRWSLLAIRELAVRAGEQSLAGTASQLAGELSSVTAGRNSLVDSAIATHEAAIALRELWREPDA